MLKIMKAHFQIIAQVLKVINKVGETTSFANVRILKHHKIIYKVD